MFERVFVIINPKSGKQEATVSILDGVFADNGVEWDAGILREGNVGELVERANSFGADVVGVYGGDGTVSAVGGELSGGDLPMGILPGGTANVLSKELKIDGDLVKAVQQLVSSRGKVVDIDVGKVNDKFFLTQVSIGYGSKVVDVTSDENKEQLGTFAYIAKGFKNLFGRKNVRLKITIDGKEIETEAFSCMVSNSGCLGVKDVSLSPVDIRDGKLDVFVVRDLSLESFHAVVRDVFENDQEGALLHWRGEEVRIESEGSEAVQYDGEVMKSDYYETSVFNRSLRVVAAADWE